MERCRSNHSPTHRTKRKPHSHLFSCWNRRSEDGREHTKGFAPTTSEEESLEKQGRERQQRLSWLKHQRVRCSRIHQIQKEDSYWETYGGSIPPTTTIHIVIDIFIRWYYVSRDAGCEVKHPRNPLPSSDAAWGHKAKQGLPRSIFIVFNIGRSYARNVWVVRFHFRH